MTSERPPVDQIRRDVERDGESCATGEELGVLCLDEVLYSAQFAYLTKIAQHEGWSFTFMPDHSVCFTKLRA